MQSGSGRARPRIIVRKPVLRAVPKHRRTGRPASRSWATACGSSHPGRNSTENNEDPTSAEGHRRRGASRLLAAGVARNHAAETQQGRVLDREPEHSGSPPARLPRTLSDSSYSRSFSPVLWSPGSAGFQPRDTELTCRPRVHGTGRGIGNASWPAAAGTPPCTGGSGSVPGAAGSISCNGPETRGACRLSFSLRSSQPPPRDR